MYGLLSKSYNNYRIQKEGYHGEKQVDIMYFSILETIVSVIILLLIFDMYLVDKFSLTNLAILLFILHVPFLGDLVGLFIVAYWIINYNKKSVLFSKM